MPTESFSVTTLLEPKAGHAELECEDAVAFNRRTGRFAVADGATEAYRSRTWARLLCRAWVSPKTESLKTDHLIDGTQRLGTLIELRNPMAVPWYVAAKAEQGSYATFVGMSLETLDRGSGRWKALAVGDCCLFKIRSGATTVAFPIHHPGDFGSHPYAVPSRLIRMDRLRPMVQRVHGRYQPGDVFLLMTDAVAQWFLAQVAASRPGLERLLALAREQPEKLKDLLLHERQEGRMRNDDVGILAVTCNDPSEPSRADM